MSRQCRRCEARAIVAGLCIDHIQRTSPEQLLLCIEAALACLDPASRNPDERLAVQRLYDALDGRLPRDFLS